jgi:Reverse transcriptase (RNA-dependent DNA polymerase)
MTIPNPVRDHRDTTYNLATSLAKIDVYNWLVKYGYFPESYVLPPCFAVVKRPRTTLHFRVKNDGSFKVARSECVSVHFPKSELTDRTFGVMNPRIHNDIAFHIARNWQIVVDAMVPKDSVVVSYTFPVPLDKKHPGRLGELRSGRSIYEFLSMIDDDIAAMAYRYSYLVKTDIKNFYPSIYTHSIAWALHGKDTIRKGNTHNFRLLGNRLDRLFQNANDGCTNGVPIGPVVSDVIAEIVAAGVDRGLSKALGKSDIDCEVIRFKDDYRILVKSEADGRTVIKYLQAALKECNLELSDDKTAIWKLPDGLFREWVSMYHAIHPKGKSSFSWKEFRELYLAVLRIDKACPGTGVIDRFLADIISRKGKLKIGLVRSNLPKVISMLLMLATLRIKAFPKVVAIIEAVLKSPFGVWHRAEIIEYLEQYLRSLSKDEERNKYLISWISYFLVSNDLKKELAFKPKYIDPITRSIYNNQGALFKDCKEYKIFVGCRKVGKRVSMLEHLDVFNPPKGA